MARKEKNVRRAAVSVLRAWAKGHDYADSLISKHAERNELKSNDRALLQAIIMAVLRNRSLLDYWIGKIRKGKLDHEVRDVLRVGMAQLMILRIPDHAAVNETVNCARTPVRGLINAILRKALLLRKRFGQELENVPFPIQYSHPEWLWKRWRKAYGGDEVIKLATWNNEPAVNYVRVNPLCPIEIDFEACALEATEDPRFYKVIERLPLDLIKGGHVYVQDLATRHAIDLLDAKPQEVVLDACAAPGGKSGMIAAQMCNTGTLVCTDSNPKRITRLSENLYRMGVSIADVQAHDWRHFAPQRWHGKFDAILADVPCSNTGVMRRRIDVKWRLTPAQIVELVELQRVIVKNLLPCLKANGRLIYSTCSIDEEENAQVIASLLSEFPQLRCTQQQALYPHIHLTDGGFAAELIVTE